MNPNFLIFGPDYGKLSQAVENTRQHPNALALPIFDLIEKNFGEIFHDLDLLRNCYVPQRQGRGGLGIFWNERERSWGNEAGIRVDKSLNLEWIEDVALRLVVREIVSIDGAIQSWMQSSQLPSSILPTQRLFFVEGNIGSGKSTLLHYFQKLLVPELPERTSVDFKIVPAIVNLNNIRPKTDIDQTWSEALALIRQELEISTNLRSTEDWIRIARHDTHHENGEYLPSIKLAADPLLAFQEVVLRSVDHLTFIRRVAHYFRHSEPRGLIVLIFDNLDIHTSLGEQLFIIKRIHELLAACPLLSALISVRTRNRNRIGRFQKEFNEFFIIKGIAINNPKIGEMVQKRFDFCLGQIETTRDLRATVRIGQNVTLSPADVTQIFANVKSAFTIPQKPQSHAEGLYAFDHPAQFLQSNSNGNCRDCLDTVKNILTSHALQTGPVVVSYFRQKELRLRGVQLPRLKLDEVIRLVAVGNHLFYDRAFKPKLFNVFGAEHRPTPQNGRFPALILYRFLQYFSKHDTILCSEVRNIFRCFGYTVPEVNRFLSAFLESKFLETDDDDELEKVEVLHATSKADYYFSYLCKNLTYLENVRNDIPINYSTIPHEIRASLGSDVPELFKFVAFILEQEILELNFFRDQKPTQKERFRRIITNEPIALRLAASIVNRCNELYKHRRDLFPQDLKGIVSNLDFLKEELRRFVRDSGEFYPDAQDGDIDKIRFTGAEGNRAIHNL